MIQMRPSVAVSAVINSIRQFYDAGPGVTQTTMLGASGSVPALYEDFTTGQSLDPRITFTRASSATRFDSTGTLVTMSSNEPRFDYDPVALQPKGLLIEEQRTNLLTYSSEFDNAAWTKSNASITPNAIAAPDGSVTADKLVEDTANAQHHVRAAYTATNSTLTLSVYAKAAERGYLFMQLSNNSTGAAGAFYNLANGTAQVATNGGDFTSSSSAIVAIGNGWYRCSLTTTKGAANNAAWPYITVSNGTASYQGDGTSGLYIWGAQLEAGSFATSYIPTTTAAATRSADVATMTGTNFSSWYNASEGTLFAEFDKSNNTNSGRIFTISNGTANNQIRINGSIGTTIRPDWQIVDGGVVQANITDSAQGGVNVVIKSAGAYLVNSFALATNGTLGTTDTNGSVPTVSQANLGANEAGAGYLNGHIRRITYYPRRLTSAELQAITA